MKVESPVKGWPKTKPLKGGVGWRLKARYLTPQRARLTNSFTGIVILGGIIFLGWSFGEKQYSSAQEFFTMAGIFLLGVILMLVTQRFWSRLIFGKTTTMEFMPDKIRIKGIVGFKNYDRNLPHEFDFRLHDDAEKEQEQEQRLRKRQEKYFRQSFHIILRYAGQRIDVASVYGRKHAEALLVRLQLLDQLMDAARNVGGASPAYSNSDKQYGNRPKAG